MKNLTHKQIDYLWMIPTAIGAFLLSGVFCYSGVSELFSSSFFVMNLGIIVLFCALVTFGAGVFLIRSIGTYTEVDEKGMRLKRFAKTVNSIDWNEIKEVGMGKANTPWGEVNKIYFAKDHLEESAVNDLDTAQKKVIYFSRIRPEYREYFLKYCPMSAATIAQFDSMPHMVKKENN